MSCNATPQLSKYDLEQLLHSKVECFTSSMLTAPGENYGSTMLQVDLSLLPDHRKIYIAAKMVPASPHMRKFFKIEETMRKEIDMYLLVAPELYTIQKEYNVPEDVFLDVIPKCYGARAPRVDDIDLDESAALLLENLKSSGYRMVDRIVGMDLKHAEYVVTRLARFHATAVAIKLKKPRVFEGNLLKATAYISSSPPPGNMGPLDIIDALSNVPLIVQHKDKLAALIQKQTEQRRSEAAPTPREPFATLIHQDFWINNMMFSYCGSDGGDIRSFKILDFQSITFGSPAMDLIFFLFSSTDLTVTKEHFDSLILLYHKQFIMWLEFFGFDTKSFSYETFLEEVAVVAPSEFAHLFFMLRIICLSSSKAPDLSQSSEFERLYTDNSGYGEIYYKKLERIVQQFLDRNWI